MTQPSYYAIIPAHVRYCKDIEQGAKLLYAELTALAAKEGYCWARNQYFADLYNVDISTIKRWLTSLKTQKFIEVEIETGGFQTERKIWISMEIKEMFTAAQKRAGGDSKMNRRGGENEPHINKESNTLNKKPPKSPKGGERESFGSFVRLSKKEYQDALDLCGKKMFDEIIEEMNDWCEANGKAYKSYAAAIRTWRKRRLKDPKKVKTNQTQTNHEWAKKIIELSALKNKLEAYDEYIVFKGIGPSPDIVIRFSENGFKDQVINRLRKMGIKIDESILSDGNLSF